VEIDRRRLKNISKIIIQVKKFQVHFLSLV